MREIPESVVRGIMDPFVSPRGGKFVRPQIKASWLKDPISVEDTNIAWNTLTEADEEEHFSVTGLRSARLVGRPDARSHSQPGAFALTEANTLKLRRPGSARVESGRAAYKRIHSGCARPRSANKMWFDNLSRRDDDAESKDDHIEDVKCTILPEEVQDPSRRKMRKGKFTLADRLNSRANITTETHSRRPEDSATRAHLAHSVTVWKKLLAERPSDSITPCMLRKLQPRAVKKSMFQSCLSNPHGYGWPRPQSAEGFADGSSSGDGVFSQLDSRPTTPAIEEVQMNLAMDATRFEKKYKCSTEVDHLKLYRGPASHSPSPQGSRAASPQQTRDSDTPQTPWPPDWQQLPWPPDWRPSTPQLDYDEDVVLDVEQPCPPVNLETRGAYHLEQQAPNIQAPYTTAALDLVPSNDSEQCPKFNVSTLRRWFNIVSLGTDVVRRRQLVFALNENEDIFCVFCGAELHKHIRSVEKTEGKRQVWNRWKLTEASFEVRMLMMRRGLEVLDRIDWEWKQHHKSTREDRGRRLLSRGSLSRKLAFEVFLTYFKYMDMLLEYNDTPNLNWNWHIFGSKDIAKGMSPEAFTRIAMEALGSPKPPQDDGLDEDNIKDVSDVTHAFSSFRRRENR